MHLDVTHASGLALLTAARSRELYLRQVLADGRVDPELMPALTAEVALLTQLILALTAALQTDD